VTHDRAHVLTIRRAGVDDAPAAAALWWRAREAALGAIPAPVHTEAEVREWFGLRVVRQCELWLAEDETSRLAGLLALDGEWVDQLYVDPDRTGGGIGSRLLAVAKRERPVGLRLWTFASNTRARRFYERHGFVAVERTDGGGNEEGAPDILYEYRGDA
jgi:GNAT superfamily N-acetyltransferase